MLASVVFQACALITLIEATKSTILLTFHAYYVSVLVYATDAIQSL